MNIKALRAFRAIVSEGSMNAAARSLNLSQPAVSRLIALLENELQLTLFERKRRRLFLTDAGRAFEREAGRILANLDEIPRIAAEIRSSHVRRLRIVTMPRIALSIVTPAIAAFSVKHPDVEISVDLRARRDLELWIGGKEYDIGFGNVPVTHRAVRGIPLVRACIEVLMPRHHSLAARDVLSPEDLARESLIAQFPGLLLRRQIDEIFQSRDIDMHYRMTTGSSQIASHLVANGAGITLIDRLSTATLPPDKVVVRPLEPKRWVAFGAILPVDGTPPPLVEDLIAHVRRQIDAQVVPGRVETHRDGAELTVSHHRPVRSD